MSLLYSGIIRWECMGMAFIHCDIRIECEQSIDNTLLKVTFHSVIFGKLSQHHHHHHPPPPLLPPLPPPPLPPQLVTLRTRLIK